MAKGAFARFRTRRFQFLALGCLASFLFAWSAPALADLGARVGTGTARGVTYQFQEVYYRAKLPWSAGDPESWHATSRLELNAGRLAVADEALTTVGGGVNLRISNPRAPVRMSLGAGPTYFSQTTLGDRDFGGHWQFTTYAAIYARVSPNAALGYRIQHTANKGVYDPDNGLTVQGFELRIGM